jgi:hypothetical protein
VKDDLMIDDPAVEKVLVELIELFPNPQSHGQRSVAGDWSSKSDIIGGFSTSRSDDPSVVVRLASSNNEPVGITATGDGSAGNIVLAAGGVYEVRFLAAIPEAPQKLADTIPPTAQRFGKGVWEGLRKFSAPTGAKYRLGPPLVLTFEVSTDAMPRLYRVPEDTDQDSPMQADRLIAQGGDKARVMLRQQFAIASYPTIRYVNRVSLLNQRWGWRGRSAATLPPVEEFPAKPTAGSSAALVAAPPPLDRSTRLPEGDVKDFESIAFIDRRDDDIGVVDEVKLHLAHILPGIANDGTLRGPDDDGRPPLLQKDLLYKGGANWWRFALSATSRYAAMKRGRNLVRYSHVRPDESAADWHTLIVRDRDTGRVPKRPGLLLVLPLTETVMSDVAVPPLLAIFSEPMFPGFHIGDGVEAALDYVRYPLTDRQRFWPEVGPDSTLTAAGHSGTPVPIRIDGPFGYTFDVGTEAPNFGRSGYLFTPLSGANNTEIRPWLLVRLRFRRLEAIETSLYRPYSTNDNKGATADLLLTSAGVTLSPDASAPVPPEFHEGLVLDFLQVTAFPTSATVSVTQPPKYTDPWSNHTVTVTVTIPPASPDQLALAVTTDLGGGGTYSLTLRPASRAWLRVVLSQRDKPQDGNTLYEPVLDVSIRLFVDDGEDGLVRSQAGSWVTVACVPLLAGAKAFKPADPVYVNVVPGHDNVGGLPQVYGGRLTSFTPPLWCQFTQDVSTFDVATTADSTLQSYSVAKFTVALDKNKAPVLAVKSSAAAVETVQSIRWLRPDAGSQIASVVAAIVTEFITDVSDRVRERPIAVYRIDDGQPPSGTSPGTAAVARLLWPTDPNARGKLATRTPARVRLMSMMHLQLDPTATPPASLADYFNEPFDDTIGMTANDAVGRILGVSKPIDVST